MLFRLFTILVLTLLLQLPFNPPLGAATLYTWNTGNGSWHIANNWNPAVIPNSPNHLAWIRHFTQNITVSLNSSAVVGGLEIDTGNTLQVPNSVSMYFGQSGGTSATIINNGIIRLNSSGSPTYFQNDGDDATLTGLGRLVLGGNLNNIISGSSFTNDLNHTIEGGGTINCMLGNLGKVIANNGILRITGGIGSVEGSEASLAAMGKDNVLYLQCNVTGGKLQPNDGKIVLEGAALYYVDIEDGHLEVGNEDSAFMGNITLSSKTEVIVPDGHGIACIGLGPVMNNGTIRLNSVGNNTGMVISGEMNGSGRIVLNGNSNNVLGGDFINGETHTVEGGGHIMASFENKGRIIANNNTLIISGHIFGDGNIHVSDNATLELISGWDLETGNFSMERLATLNVSESKIIGLKNNFSFSQTEDTKWVGGNYITLQMSGGGSAPQSLEVGGKDLGAVANGFNNNFSLGSLSIMGDKTYVFLIDSIDNGHRASAEALYASFLSVYPGSTLNLNRIHLYTYLDGEVHRVAAGEGDMFGGGNIIDKPERKVALPFLNLLLD